ncbi:hypothetical protein E3N88_05050 [Mikania micrantha]|uniref:Arabidopsis retrotransposon Orf1 C-terminal domain-containing protein n=1 Tax=Mikania micrantha TaxID=192012 RepID=A0A5N6PWN9_9ASTR|nr:hypothetical protein E3N88_05050 [Mikania micrantha]
MGNQKAIDYDLLAELGQQERMTAIIGEDTPWSRLFEMTYAPQYRLITVEFLSTFRYRPRPHDFQPQPSQAQPAEVSFRLCGAAYHLSLAEFGSVLGLYTEEETHMPIYTTAIHTVDDAVVSAWWPRIGDDAFVRCARVTRIRDPLIRYLHRCIASSVTGRGMSQEWGTLQDLFFLYGACRYGGLSSSSFRSTDSAWHAYRADIPTGRASIFAPEGGHLAAGPNDLHYRDEDPMPVFQQAQPQPQQQPQQPPPPPPQPPHGEGEPHPDVPQQHPERVYRAVRLPARVEAMIQGIADSTQQLIQQHEHMQQQQLELTQQMLQIQQQQAQILQQQALIQQQQVEHSQRVAQSSEQLTRRVDRLEDLISWHVHVELRHAEGEGIQLPAVPMPRDYPPPPPPLP